MIEIRRFVITRQLVLHRLQQQEHVLQGIAKAGRYRREVTGNSGIHVIKQNFRGKVPTQLPPRTAPDFHLAREVRGQHVLGQRGIGVQTRRRVRHVETEHVCDRWCLHVRSGLVEPHVRWLVLNRRCWFAR